MGQMKYLKLPPNLRLCRPSCQFTESRASRTVSQACIGVAIKVSPIPEYPCTLNQGAPNAPLPPKPTPWMPSCDTMSLLSLFSDERCIDSREKLIDAIFTSVGLMIRFHPTTACWEKLS